MGRRLVLFMRRHMGRTVLNALLGMLLTALMSSCSLLGSSESAKQPAPQPAPVVEAAPEPTPPPPAPEKFYVVKKGDNLGAISKKNSITIKDLQSANPSVKTSKDLKAGMKLKIPVKAAETAAAGVVKPLEAATAPDKTAGKDKQPQVVSEKQPVEKIVPEKPEKEVKGKGKKGKDDLDKLLANEDASSKKHPVKDDPAALERIGKEFNEYCKNWINKLEQLGISSGGKKEIRKEGAKYIATWQEIRKQSMHTEVKQTEYAHSPYVGHLTYDVVIYEAVGDTPEAAQKATPTNREQMMREIFSYSAEKKGWR